MERGNAWGEVVERIVQGFTHDLNNRLLVLVGVRDLLEPPAPADDELLELLDRELDGLENETRLLRRLVVPDAEAEPCDPREILDTARQLHRRHRGLQGIEVQWLMEEPLPAIHAAPSDLLQATLLALAASGRAALDAGADSAEIRAHAEAGRLLLTLAPGAAATSPFVAAAGAAAERAGGGLDATAGLRDGAPGTLRLWLPRLDGGTAEAG